MDKLKYVRLENIDGSYSDPVALSVDTQNIDVGNSNLNNYLIQNNTDINGLKNTDINLTQKVNDNTSAIRSLASGAPKGSYATTDALILANPDTGVYVVTLDGHLYSWTKNGANVIDLGVYQAILDDSYVRYEENDNVSLYNPDDLVSGYLYNSSGSIGQNSSYCTTGFIPVVANVNYLLVGQYRKFLAYDSNKTAISATYEDNSITDYVFTPSQNGFIRATVSENKKDNEEYYYILKGYSSKDSVDFSQIQRYGSIVDKAFFSKKEMNYLKEKEYAQEKLNAYKGEDLHIDDYYESGHYYRGNVGQEIISSSSSSISSYKIPIEKEELIHIRSFDHKTVFSAIVTDNENVITVRYANSESSHSSSDSNYYLYDEIISAPNTGFLYLPYYENAPSEIKKNQQCEKIIGYVPAISEAKTVSLINQAISEIDPQTQIEELQAQVEALKASNILWGKKYVACGDSFTRGDFGGYVDPDGHSGTESDAYDTEWNMYKTYPYWIAKRNNMTLINEARNGTTMTTLERNDAFSINRYKNIPEDADYITLKFGINDDDSHQHAPIGTIDDNVATTFYGAWNITMDYIIRNHPYAKIGIIIGNGLNGAETGEPYCEAMRNIAKKWGLPYLDEDLDDQVPLTFRTNKTYVNSDIANFRASAFRVANSNMHPGLACHKYESTIVENFLRRL